MWWRETATSRRAELGPRSISITRHLRLSHAAFQREDPLVDLDTISGACKAPAYGGYGSIRVRARCYPVSENSPLVLLYWSGIVLSVFGMIAWIAAGLNVHSSSFFSGDRVNDTAVAWVTVGTTVTTIGVLALLLALRSML